MRSLLRRARSFDPWLGALVVIFSIAYGSTLLTSVGYSGDTAKFQFLGHVPGTAHEPGEPTYLLLLQAFDRLVPFGSPAMRASLLSAVVAIFTLVAVDRILRRLSASRPAAAAGASLLGVLPVFWSQAVVAEVYTLHTLFLALILYSFLRWKQEQTLRWFVAGVAATALSFGNHLTTITFVPGLVVFVAMVDRRAFVDPKRIAIVLALIVAGAAQYLVVFARAADPSTAYVEMAPTDLTSFYYYVAGGQFAGQWYPYSWSWMFLHRLPIVSGMVWYELGLFLIPVAAGILAIHDRRFRWLLVLVMLGTGAFAAGYVIHDVFIYFLPVYLVGAVGYGAAVHAVATRVAERWRALALLALALLPLVWGARSWAWIDQHRSPRMEVTAREALASVPDGSVLVVPDYDYAAVLWYLTIGERSGSTTTVLHLHSARDFESAPHEYAVRLEEYLLGRRPLFVPVERRSIAPGARVFWFTPFSKTAPPIQSRSLVRLNPELSLRTRIDRRDEWYRTFSRRELRFVPFADDLEEIIPASPPLSPASQR